MYGVIPADGIPIFAATTATTNGSLDRSGPRSGPMHLIEMSFEMKKKSGSRSAFFSAQKTAKVCVQMSGNEFSRFFYRTTVVVVIAVVVVAVVIIIAIAFTFTCAIIELFDFHQFCDAQCQGSGFGFVHHWFLTTAVAARILTFVRSCEIE